MVVGVVAVVAVVVINSGYSNSSGGGCSSYCFDRLIERSDDTHQNSCCTCIYRSTVHVCF